MKYLVFKKCMKLESIIYLFLCSIHIIPQHDNFESLIISTTVSQRFVINSLSTLRNEYKFYLHN